jgi:hypothetical protein
VTAASRWLAAALAQEIDIAPRQYSRYWLVAPLAGSTADTWSDRPADAR